MAHSSDPQKEKSSPLEKDLSEQIPVIDQICPLSHARKIVQASPAGLDPPDKERSRPKKVQAYPIFDRDGKVARMIGADKTVASADSGSISQEESPQQEPILFCGMVGNSKQMRALFHLIRLVSSSNTTILVYGESGTGKELVARAIHQCSSRRHRSFIPVDCGALPETLLESELFGHVKGAFTGAIQNKKGLFVEAEGGTLFLDEIGDTSMAFQSKLLRALQEGEVRPVGGNQSVKINVRVVAATNKLLKEAVAKKMFREDLYYRLAVMPIVIPPLRERPDDILPVARYFIQKYAEQSGKGKMHLSGDAADLLLRLPWRGNIRELENVIERAVLVSPGNLISAESLLIEEETMVPGDLASTSFSNPSEPTPVPLSVAIEKVCSRAERERITDAIRKNNGNKSLAARSLGIARSSLYNKLKRYKIETHDHPVPGF